MPWMVFRVILRRFMRCSTETCLKLMSGLGGVLSFYVLAVYSNSETSGSSASRILEVVYSAAVIAVSAGLFYGFHRCCRQGRYAELLLRQLFGERRWSIAAGLMVESILLTAASVLAALMLIDLTFNYFKIPVDDWKVHLPGLLVKSSLMGFVSGAAVACQACRYSIISLLEKLNDQQGISAR